MNYEKGRQTKGRGTRTKTYPPIYLHLLRLLLFYSHHRRCFLDHCCSFVRGLTGQRWARSIPCRDVVGFTPPSSWTSNNANSPPSFSLITPRDFHLLRAFVITDSSMPPPTLDINVSVVHISAKCLQTPEQSLIAELATDLSPQRVRSQQPRVV